MCITNRKNQDNLCHGFSRVLQVLQHGEAANAYAEYLSMISYLEKSGIEIERETTSFDGETLLGIYFYNSVLSTALSHTVREIIKAYKDGVLDDTILQMQYKDSLRTFNVPIEK